MFNQLEAPETKEQRRQRRRERRARKASQVEAESQPRTALLNRDDQGNELSSPIRRKRWTSAKKRSSDDAKQRSLNDDGKVTQLSATSGKKKRKRTACLETG